VLLSQPLYGMMEALPAFQRIDRTPVLMMDEFTSFQSLNTTPVIVGMHEMPALTKIDDMPHAWLYKEE